MTAKIKKLKKVRIVQYVKQNRNLPRIASKSAVVTVLYSPSDTRSRKKMTLLELEGTQPQRTYLTQRLSCENLQQRNNQQPECSEMVVLLIHELFQTDKLFFLRYMGSLSAEHQKLIIAMEILTCPVSLAITSDGVFPLPLVLFCMFEIQIFYCY